MKLLEVIFGSQNLAKDTSMDGLVAEGFSWDEAVKLNWLIRRMDYGKYIGLGLSAILLLSIHKSKYVPLPLLKNKLSLRAAAATIIGCYYTGNFLFNYNRRGANSNIANLYTNNNLMANKFYMV